VSGGEGLSVDSTVCGWWGCAIVSGSVGEGAECLVWGGW